MKITSNFYFPLFCCAFIVGCSDNSPSESDLRGALQNYINNNEQFVVELPLNNTRLSAGDLLLDLKLSSVDFSLLQIISNKGIMNRIDEPGMTARYRVAEGKENLVKLYPNGRASILLGETNVHEVVGFTDVVDEEGINKTYVTVEFRNKYADWIDEKDIQALRDWTVVIADTLGEAGTPPAFRPYHTVFTEFAFISMMSSLGGGGIFDLPQSSVYWVNLALESYHMQVPFLRNDDGWTPVPDISQWELQDINGIGSLTYDDIENNVESMLDTILGSIEKAPPPDEETILLAVESNVSGPMVYQTPMQENGEKTCVAEYATDLMGRKKDIEYSCTSRVIEQLQVMINNGHVFRSIPSAGEVKYYLSEEYRDQLSSSGQLIIGNYEVGGIQNGDVDIDMNGFSTYRFDIEVLSTPFEWATPYVTDSQKSAINIPARMIYAGGEWMVAH